LLLRCCGCACVLHAVGCTRRVVGHVTLAVPGIVDRARYGAEMVAAEAAAKVCTCRCGAVSLPVDSSGAHVAGDTHWAVVC
jgi:hypothetical protein